jgi:hypothetical protein
MMPNLAPTFALSVALVIAMENAPIRGQAPATDPGGTSSIPNGNRPQEANGVSLGTPVPAAPQAERGPSPAPYPAPALPAGPVEPPAAPPSAEGGPQAPIPDVFGHSASGLAPFLNPTVGHAPIRADYRAAWFASEPVSGQPTKLGYVQQDFSISCPLWQCGTTDEWLVSANLRNETYHTHALLPDTRQPFPEDLWNVRFSTTYRHLFDNGWIGGGSVSVGSASDQPFHGIDEMTAGVSAFLRIPQGERNAWLFSLSYSPTSELPFPIPGVAYIWQPSEDFRANVGLPFAIMWRPVNDLTLDFSYMLLTTVHARATYRLCRPVRIYAGYAWENEGYLLADRIDSNDRFYNVDQRLFAGVQYNFSPRVSLDLSGGYVFDHYYFEGKNITSGTNFNRVNVGDGPYLSLQFQVRW